MKPNISGDMTAKHFLVTLKTNTHSFNTWSCAVLYIRINEYAHIHTYVFFFSVFLSLALEHSLALSYVCIMGFTHRILNLQIDIILLYSYIVNIMIYLSFMQSAQFILIINVNIGLVYIYPNRCPLSNRCLAKSVVIGFTITSVDNPLTSMSFYVGNTMNIFKKHYCNNISSFNISDKRNKTLTFQVFLGFKG